MLNPVLLCSYDRAMQKDRRHRQPWDWRGQMIQLALIALVSAVSASVAYIAAVMAAHLVSGGPPPVPDGWQDTVVQVVLYVVLFGLMIPGFIWSARYVRKNRGRML